MDSLIDFVFWLIETIAFLVGLLRASALNLFYTVRELVVKPNSVRAGAPPNKTAKLKIHSRITPLSPSTTATGSGYCVTGGLGFLGSHVVEGLLARGEKKIVIIDYGFDYHQLFKKEQEQGIVTIEKLDLSSLNAIEELINIFIKHNIQVIIHTAAIIDFSSRLWFDYERSYKINVIGTENLLKAAMDPKTLVQYFIHTSSSTVTLHSGPHNSYPWSMYSPSSSAHILKGYRDPSKARPLTEEDMLLPSSLRHSLCHYTSTKLEAERLVLSYNGAVKGLDYNIVKTAGTNSVINYNSKPGDKVLKTIAIRPNGIYGPRDVICIGLLEYSPPTIDNGNRYQDEIYVENVVHAFFCSERALRAENDNNDNNNKSRVSGEAYFITSGDDVKHVDFHNEVDKVWGKPRSTLNIKVASVMCILVELFRYLTRGLIDLGKLGMMGPPVTDILSYNLVFDDSKARNNLGYKPLVSTQVGIQRSVDYFKKHNAQ